MGSFWLSYQGVPFDESIIVESIETKTVPCVAPNPPNNLPPYTNFTQKTHRVTNQKIPHHTKKIPHPGLITAARAAAADMFKCRYLVPEFLPSLVRIPQHEPRARAPHDWAARQGPYPFREPRRWMPNSLRGAAESSFPRPIRCCCLRSAGLYESIYMHVRGSLRIVRRST